MSDLHPRGERWKNKGKQKKASHLESLQTRHAIAHLLRQTRDAVAAELEHPDAVKHRGVGGAAQAFSRQRQLLHRRLGLRCGLPRPPVNLRLAPQREQSGGGGDGRRRRAMIDDAAPPCRRRVDLLRRRQRLRQLALLLAVQSPAVAQLASPRARRSLLRRRIESQAAPRMFAFALVFVSSSLFLFLYFIFVLLFAFARGEASRIHTLRPTKQTRGSGSTAGCACWRVLVCVGVCGWGLGGYETTTSVRRAEFYFCFHSETVEKKRND